MKHIPAPAGDPDGVLQLLIANLDYSDYLGPPRHRPHLLGHACESATTVAVAKRDGSLQNDQGHQALHLRRAEAHRGRGGADCGEIVALAGFEGIAIGETVTSADDTRAAAARCTSTSRRSR